MRRIEFTKPQVEQIIENYSKGEGGVGEILKMCIETLMKAEREIHNAETGDVSNGYRLRKTYGKGKILELQVPRSRFGHFYPVILGLLKDEEEEFRKLAFGLYGAGLTTDQVGKLFKDIYGRGYSKSQISRMFDFAHKEVERWLERPLEDYYPMFYIDATFISVRREDSVSKEAFYTILGVKADRSREVLAIVNFPSESAMGWRDVLEKIKQRGVKEVGLVVCDGLTGIENAIFEYFPQTKLQLCNVHLQRNVMKYVRPKDKEEVAKNFREVFRVGEKGYTKKQAIVNWQAFTQKWGNAYPSIKRMAEKERMEWYFTYLEYDYRIQNMIYSTNWIERLNRDYKRTIKMRGALPNVQSVILLLGYVAMSREHYERKVPKLDYENKKFRWTN